jgi:hypothetical protein
MGSVVVADQDLVLMRESKPKAITFSYEGWDGETVYDLIRDMDEGEVAILCAREFGEEAMIRNLEVMVDRDLESFRIVIDLQRTKWGESLSEDTIRNKIARCFDENLNAADLSIRDEEMGLAAAVNVIVDLNEINRYVQATDTTMQHIRHLVLVNIDVVGGIHVKDINPFVKAMFGSIEDFATFIQGSKIGISKEMPKEQISIDLATKPLPQARGI